MRPIFVIGCDGFILGSTNTKNMSNLLDIEDKKNLFGFEKPEKKFVLISSGLNHNVAIDEDGNLCGWGSNKYGQLGLFGDKCSDCKFVSVSCGDFHTVALDEDGNLWSCGRNSTRQLSLPKPYKVRNNKLTQIISETKFDKISCGNKFTFALDKAGDLWSCGDNTFGQLGLYHVNPVEILTRVNLPVKFVSVSCGYCYTIALDVNGYIWICGQSIPCDDPSISCDDSQNFFEKINLDNRFVTISHGTSHFMALDVNGTLWSCGNNNCGQLGLVNIVKSICLQPVIFESRFISVYCDKKFTIALDEYNDLWFCGDNDYGMFGLKKHKSINVFTKVASNILALPNQYVIKKHVKSARPNNY